MPDEKTQAQRGGGNFPLGRTAAAEVVNQIVPPCCTALAQETVVW